jgi:hypothetical protein
MAELTNLTQAFSEFADSVNEAVMKCQIPSNPYRAIVSALD